MKKATSGNDYKQKKLFDDFAEEPEEPKQDISASISEFLKKTE